MSLVHTYPRKQEKNWNKASPYHQSQHSPRNTISPITIALPLVTFRDYMHQINVAGRITTKASFIYLLPYIDFCVSHRPGKKPQIKESKDRTATEQDCIGAKISPRFSLDPSFVPSRHHTHISPILCLFVCVD